MDVSANTSTGGSVSGLPRRRRKASKAGPGLCVVRAAALAVLLLSPSGCGPNVAQASRDLAKKITLAGTRPAPPPETGEPAPRRVYLDASLSMRGFAAFEEGTTFGTLVEGLGDDLPGCQLYKYGQRGRGPAPDGAALIQAARFGRELRRPQFYDLDYNPDDRLLTQLAEEESPAFSVLITDGVYSVPDGATSPPIVEAVNKWFDRGYAFGIFVFKSPFRGTIYAENRPVGVPNVSVGERPFYAFVLSPSERELNAFWQKLHQRMPQARAILFSDSSVVTKVDFSERTKGTYSFQRPPGAPYHWHMLDADAFGDGGRAAVDYVVSYIVAPDYPVSEFRFDLAATYYRWDGNRFVEVKGGPAAGFDHKFGEVTMQDASAAEPATRPGAEGQRTAKPKPNLKIVYPKDPEGAYGFYHLRLVGSPKSLRTDIRDLSTRDDTDPRNAGSTFRFYELVNAITEIHFGRLRAAKNSPALFVTIANR
ncbi:MAG TPA: hypothetical protein VF297_22325 [Pyrinomonadaceae bacterium]